jgi:hypothetical protein
VNVLLSVDLISMTPWHNANQEFALWVWILGCYILYTYILCMSVAFHTVWHVRTRHIEILQPSCVNRQVVSFQKKKDKLFRPVKSQFSGCNVPEKQCTIRAINISTVHLDLYSGLNDARIIRMGMASQHLCLISGDNI